MHILSIKSGMKPVHTRSSASHSYGQVLHIVHTTENVELTFLFAHPMEDFFYIAINISKMGFQHLTYAI